ncbi:PRC-barrel domain-containing protein [Pseudooctadecabacter jejudonensis]|uniref:PRC-barrel domain protein n=1 Tax=Pseudooctadecabacter jejudonensis TaxID=1391910 RepID=A0A1Y5S806_9RHOB|nr:PRC-barrel domain-containing protein [Pseudooctadecabacter jejudonensis]SLN33194.1 PRC-barrel domain protein [Pseudooctadecabacter jejudonensis]
MFKTLMTTTALTIALTAPSFAETETEDTAMDVEMEETFANVDTEVEGEDGDMMTADAADDATLAGDGEDDMTVTAETLNGEADMDSEGTLTADADMAMEDEGLEQISQFSGMTVDQIVGLDVMSADGEDVGEIDYVISDGMDYKAVIGIGGFLGLGEYTVALPLGNFAMIDGELILDEATEAELEAMPEIDESELEGLEGDYVIS